MTTKIYRSALVTGGAGFIAKATMPLLESICDRITVYDCLIEQVHGRDAAIPIHCEPHEFVRADVRDRDRLADCVARAEPDLVIHLAADTGTGQSYDEVSRYTEVNVQGTAYLAEALRRLTRAARRVVLASSRAIYGEGGYRTVDGALVVPPPRREEDLAAGRFAPRDAQGRLLEPVATPEDIPIRPGSIYASTKLMQEYVLEQALVGTGIDLVTLRFQNVYGAGQSLRNPYTGVLSIFGGIVTRGETLDIYEDGDIVRDFVHVRDVARSIAAAATVTPAPQVPINIGSGAAVRILDAARILLRAMGRPESDYAISGRYRIGDIRHARADIGRAAALLEWQPTVSIEDGITELARWIAETL